MNNWISVKDELPPFNVPVLIICDVHPLLRIQTVAWRVRQSKKIWYTDNFNMHSFKKDCSIRTIGNLSKYVITHWMLLPKFPEKIKL